MSRIAKKAVHAALDRAAAHILAARGDDPFVSRRDLRTKLLELQGVERSLTDIFYRFIDHRDARPGARVTAKDVAATLAYAKEKLIDQYDLNRNGLSAAEVSQMSRTGKLAVALAYELKRSAAAETEDWLLELDELRKGVFYQAYASESEDGLTPVRIESRLEDLNRDTFAKALQLDPANPKQTITIFESKAQLIDPSRTFLVGSDEGVSRAQRINNLAADYLRDFHQIILGVDDTSVLVEHPAYLVGLTARGEIVGYRTTVIWT